MIDHFVVVFIRILLLAIFSILSEEQVNSSWRKFKYFRGTGLEPLLIDSNPLSLAFFLHQIGNNTAFFRCSDILFDEIGDKTAEDGEVFRQIGEMLAIIV